MVKGGYHPLLAPGDAPRLVIKLDGGDDPQQIVAIAKQHIANLKTPGPAGRSRSRTRRSSRTRSRLWRRSPPVWPT